MELNWKDFFLRTAGVKETIALLLFCVIILCIYVLGVNVNSNIRTLSENTKGLNENIIFLKGKVESIEDDVNSFKGDLNSLKNKLSELEVQQKIIKENAVNKVEKVTSKSDDSGGDVTYYIENATINTDDADPASVQSQKVAFKNNKRER